MVTAVSPILKEVCGSIWRDFV